MQAIQAKTPTYLRVPFMIAMRSSKLYECKTGSSEHMSSCCMEVMKGNKACGNDPSTFSTLSTRTNNDRTGTFTC